MILSHVVLEVGERLGRPGGLDAGVLLDAAAELVVGEGEHPAVGVVNEHDFLGAEQPLADGQGAHFVVRESRKRSCRAPSSPASVLVSVLAQQLCEIPAAVAMADPMAGRTVALTDPNGSLGPGAAPHGG